MTGSGVLRRLTRWVLAVGAVWTVREFLFARNLRRYGPPGPPQVTVPPEIGPETNGPETNGPETNGPRETPPQVAVPQEIV